MSSSIGRRSATRSTASWCVATGEALRDAAADTSVRCVVIRGAGPMFSSGMDLGSLAALSEAPEDLRAFRARHAWTPGTWPRR